MLHQKQVIFLQWHKKIRNCSIQQIRPPGAGLRRVNATSHPFIGELILVCATANLWFCIIVVIHIGHIGQTGAHVHAHPAKMLPFGRIFQHHRMKVFQCVCWQHHIAVLYDGQEYLRRCDLLQSLVCIQLIWQIGFFHSFVGQLPFVDWVVGTRMNFFECRTGLLLMYVDDMIEKQHPNLYQLVILVSFERYSTDCYRHRYCDPNKLAWQLTEFCLQSLFTFSMTLRYVTDHADDWCLGIWSSSSQYQTDYCL